MDQSPLPSSSASSAQSPRELSRLLIGHYGEMVLPVALTLGAFALLPREIEWLALLPLGALYGAAAARMLDIRREPLVALTKQRAQAFALTALSGLIILAGVFIAAYFLANLVTVFSGGRHWASLIAFAVMLGAGYKLMRSHWPLLGVPFVYDGLVDQNGKWTPPATGPLKELLQQRDVKARFTRPMLRSFSMCIVVYIVVVYMVPDLMALNLRGFRGLGSQSWFPWTLIWAGKIAFAVYLFPLFMLTLVQTTRDLAIVEGSWVEAAEVVETPPALQQALQVQDGSAGDVAVGADSPEDEELDDGSNRRVKVYNFERPAGGAPAGPSSPEAGAGPQAPQYTIFGAQMGGPSPTPPGVAVPGKSAMAKPGAMTGGGPAIDFTPAGREPQKTAPPEPTIPPRPAAAPLAAGASVPPQPAAGAPKAKTAKDFALDELEDVVEAAGAAGGGELGAILAALDRGDGEAIRNAVAQGANPNALDAGGRPLLLRAVEAGEAAAVEALLGTGANPDARDGRGRTALMTALAAGRDDLADLLLHRGASPRGADHEGRGALMLALARHRAAPEGEGPKSQADVPIIRRLLNAGADVKAAAPDGETAMHLAARRGDMDLVNALFFAGADVNAAKSDGTTPLMEAERAGHALVAGRLRMWGAKE